MELCTIRNFDCTLLRVSYFVRYVEVASKIETHQQKLEEIAAKAKAERDAEIAKKKAEEKAKKAERKARKKQKKANQ